VDDKRPLGLLLEGRPGIGKTTVARRLLALMRDAGIPLGGFVTDEIRSGGHRQGFTVQTVAGQRGVLAHVQLPGPPRVGRYGVDLPAFERVALPAIVAPPPVGVVVVVVDELGKMELASAAFRDAMSDLLDQQVAVVATVHVHRHPFTDALKRRPDLRVIRVTERNRDALPERLAAELAAADAVHRPS
jgi:nucleoside-triphosphatase